MARGRAVCAPVPMQFRIEEPVPVALPIEPAFAAETPARRRQSGINILGQFTGS